MQQRVDAWPTVMPASPAAFDVVAAAADPRHAFLRTAWYRADAGAALDAVVASRADGSALAAIPLVQRRRGPIGIGVIPGCYWPFRSFPVARDAAPEEITAMLRVSAVRRFLGPVWRMGPVFADDPTARLLLAGAPAAGWSVLTRRLTTCFDIDLAALRAQAPWPRSSSAKGIRYRERKLAEVGELDFRFVSGSEWTAEDREAMAQIERESPLTALGDGFHPKFADPARRCLWEQAAEDPEIASMLFCSLLHLGGEPAAFAFGIEAGGVRHCIANNYSRRFARHSPGRVLLFRDFERASARGVDRIGWGAGDAGYKSEMDAAPGPEMIDLLFVRPRPLAWMARRVWTGT